MGGLEDLDGDDKRVLKQVIVDHAIEDVDSAVVTSTGEEWELRIRVEGDLANGLVVILQCFIRRLTGHIHVEPEHFLVVGAQDEIVSFRVH